ncbi:MAG: hypothetical protein JOY59_02125 [Candidatus Eremiobacteraeota bacterium]|nr:hypothetical protein [Candidatus Eremiobacteraeota bacterium]
MIGLGLAFPLSALDESPAQSASGYSAKTVIDNARVRVLQVTESPGATSPNATRPSRVVYYFTPAKLRRNYPDGTTKVVSFAAGQTVYLAGPDNTRKYSFTNIGTNTVRLMSVQLK